MLSSYRDNLLKLSKTTSPKKLVPSDCITLYIIFQQFEYKIHAYHFDFYTPPPYTLLDVKIKTTNISYNRFRYYI